VPRGGSRAAHAETAWIQRADGNGAGPSRPACGAGATLRALRAAAGRDAPPSGAEERAGAEHGLRYWLVTVCVVPVLFVHVTEPPGCTVAAANGALLLVMLTFTAALGAPASTTTVPVITLWIVQW